VGSSIRCDDRVAFDFFNWEDLTALVNSGIAARGNSDLVFSTSSPMRDVADYRKNAEKCRELAKLTARSEHWAAFLEMAETWEKLADLHELSQKLRSSGVLLK